jgi:hypothetical protein
MKTNPMLKIYPLPYLTCTLPVCYETDIKNRNNNKNDNRLVFSTNTIQYYTVILDPPIRLDYNSYTTMTTPTNHTTSSLFDFGDMLEPEQSHSSLEQNSDIAESNIFVSYGGEMSNHTRYSSSALGGGGVGLKAGGSHCVETTNNKDVLSLAPLQEESEASASEKPVVIATLAATESHPLEANKDAISLGPQQEDSEAPADTPVVAKTVAENKIAGGNGILKPCSYSQAQQQQQQQQRDSEHRPKLTIDIEPSSVIEDSRSVATGFSASQQPSQMLSPTVHASNQTPQILSPTVHASNQTPGFSKPHLPRVLSPTVHASNQTPGLRINTARCDDRYSNDDILLNKPEIDQRSAERAAAWAIYIALIFFCILILACAVLTITVVHSYGFVTLVLMTFVIVFCASLVCFVDSTILSQNPKLKPVRQKIITVMRTTRKMLEDEYHLFIRDWKENLLITHDGEESFSRNVNENLMGDDDDCGMLRIPQPPQSKRRKKSKVFKLIRPLLGLKKKFGGKGRRQKKTKSATASASSTSTATIDDNNDAPSGLAASYKAPII